MCSFSKPKVETPAAPAPTLSEPIKTADTGGETVNQTQRRRAKGKRALRIETSTSSDGTGLSI